MSTPLTTNVMIADDHPLMKRFHRPEDEKRMVVILDPEDYGNWLTCGVQDAPGRCRDTVHPAQEQLRQRVR